MADGPPAGQGTRGHCMSFNRRLGFCLHPAVLVGSLGAPFRFSGGQSGHVVPAGVAPSWAGPSGTASL
jgi:hypothetical protein